MEKVKKNEERDPCKVVHYLVTTRREEKVIGMECRAWDESDECAFTVSPSVIL